MNNSEFIDVLRECDGYLIPSGDKIKLKQGTKVKITQSLGGDFTLYVNGNLVKISGKDADAVGFEAQQDKEIKNDHIDITKIIDEKYVWEQLKTCYDPEIPVNIVDLGLIYDLKLDFFKEKGTAVDIKMTLTAPGCGMGPAIADDAKNKVLQLPGVFDVKTGLVSVRPYPSRIVTFNEAKNSATSDDKGAPPDMKNLKAPPTLVWTFEYTNLLAMLCLIFKPIGTDLFFELHSKTSLPTPIAQ